MPGTKTTTIAEQSVKDLVCGMMVDPTTAKHHHDYEGAPYYFCSARCLDEFRAEPGRYLAPAPAPDIGSAPGMSYTCRMHPEVIQDHPGDCPKCGMALEPMMVSTEEGPNPELIDMTRRFWIGAVLTIPLLALTMGAHLPGLSLERLVPPLRPVARASTCSPCEECIEFPNLRPTCDGW